MALAFLMQALVKSNVLRGALPDWPLIFALFFAVSPVFRFGLTGAFIVGLLKDVFLDTPMGLHAVIYVLLVFVMMSLRPRFKYMDIVNQSLIIGCLVFIKVLTMVVYEGILYTFPRHYWALLSVLLSMLFWPLVCMLFRFFSTL